MNLFGYTNRLGRHEIALGNINRRIRREVSNTRGVVTVFYTSLEGSFEFIGYDKIKEMKKKKQDIPPLFDETNVLRLEYKIRKRRGIQSKFNGDLTAHSLFDENVYRRFQELFFNKYKSIAKMGRVVYVDKSENITPAKLKKIMAELFRQSHPKEYQNHFQRFIEAGKLSPISIERILTENNKLGNDFSIFDTNILIKELDDLVYNSVMLGD